MKIVLCAARFVNGDTMGNIDRISMCAEKYSGKADMLCFGEAFVQGFDGLRWNYVEDADIAVSQDSAELHLLRKIAVKNKMALAFGYMESAEGRIYSSYMVIGASGDILCNYRRMSPGWKIPGLDERYAEGNDICVFGVGGTRFTVMLCGDLWTDNVADKLKGSEADVVLWPVYTDFDADVWNATEKLEYAARANEYCGRALYVNCVCDGDGRARGGAAVFKNGRITAETPAGGESVLFVEV